MAINYFLVVRNRHQQINPGDVRKLIVSNFRPTVNPTSGFLISEGATVTVGTEGTEMAEEAGATRPGLCVAFQIDKFDQYESGITRMLQIAELILRKFEGDATLSFDFEETLLSRTDGQLAIFEIPEIWTSERKRLFAKLQQR
ncbi:SitI3 family protein [Sorangium sp. So ce861]|uniref:SitI3 family protein n=1 Tax=Sorangium sp. So ce861 TaxID=3133323 RepID=UPI003F5DDC46